MLGETTGSGLFNQSRQAESPDKRSVDPTERERYRRAV